MSNLRIFIDNSDNTIQLPATAACGEAPPAAPARGPRPTDACRITVPMTLDVASPPRPRQIAFDRQGDQFVLSSSNSEENLTWVSSNQNLAGALDTVRLTASLLRSAGRPAATSRFAVSFFLWMARYVITGDSAFDAAASEAARAPEIEGVLLELFTGSRAGGLVPLLGNINLLRRETGLSDEVRERIRRVTSILDMVPAYQTFMARFVTEEDRRNTSRLSDEDARREGRVEDFVRQTVVALGNHRPLRYDAEVLEAFRSYSQLHQSEIRAGNRPDFCSALQSALQDVGGSFAPRAGFVEECRMGIELGSRPSEDALRESLRQMLITPSGLSLLQQAIAEDSARANMRIDWLRSRGSFGQVFSAIRENIGLVGEGDSQRLTFNVAGFSRAFRMMTVLTSRGEYDLAALAFLRRLFGDGIAPNALRVFANQYFRELDWQISPEDLRQIRDLMSTLRGRRRNSESFAVNGMPALLGTGCALGVGGLVVSHTVPAITGNRDLQLGLGVASSGLAGGGCFGLAGHYLWPAVVPNAVHNRYAWDLGTSAVGSGVGIATYLLIQLLSGGRPTNMMNRFPTDPFGP